MVLERGHLVVRGGPALYELHQSFHVVLRGNDRVIHVDAGAVVAQHVGRLHVVQNHVLGFDLDRRGYTRRERILKPLFLLLVQCHSVHTLSMGRRGIGWGGGRGSPIMNQEEKEGENIKPRTCNAAMTISPLAAYSCAVVDS